jgi:hypothetical protein
MSEFNWTGSDSEGWRCETEDGYLATITVEDGIPKWVRRAWYGSEKFMGSHGHDSSHYAFLEAKEHCRFAINAHRWQHQGKAAVEAVGRVREWSNGDEAPWGSSEPGAGTSAIKYCMETVAALLPDDPNSSERGEG